MRDGLMQLAALVVIVFGLQAARSWMLPICFALLLAVLASVPLRWLGRRGVPRALAVVLSAGAVLGGGWLCVLAFTSAVRDFVTRLPVYREHLGQLLEDSVAWFASIGVEIDVRSLLESIEPRAWLGFAQQGVGGALGLLSALFLMLFALAFSLWEGDALHQRLRDAYGDDWQESRALRMVGDLQRYLGVKTATSLLTGLAVFGLNVLLGVESALLWGLLAFLLNYVPIVGSIVAAVPPVLLTMAAPELGMVTAAWLALGYLVANSVVSNLLEPVLMGQQLGMTAFAVLLSLVFWGWVWGAGGMFLAAPLTVVVGTVVGGRADLGLLRALIGR
ncbi:MAG: AI-2E family transporter [Planctomycetota bacterium]